MHTLYLPSSFFPSLALFAEVTVPQAPLPPLFSNNALVTWEVSTFEQLIDHDHPELGSFTQRYWWTSNILVKIP
jgi:hypothetical protein